MGDARDGVLAVLRDAGGGSLRDAWLFDDSGHESLYLRSDVRDRVAELDVERYIDNERYGYVTRETWESLHYTDYEFTIRGFDEFTLYRTFLGSDDDRIGLMASFDPGASVDFQAVTRDLYDQFERLPVTVEPE